MKDSGKIIKEMEEANNSGKMVVFMKVIGKIILLTDMEGLFILMEMFILVNGLVIKPTEKEPIFPSVELNT